MDVETSAIIDAGHLETTKKSGTGDLQRRATAILQVLKEVIDGVNLSVAIIEWPSAGGSGLIGKMNAKAASQTIAVAGALLGMFAGKGISTLTPAPVTWRSVLGCKRGKDAELHERLLRTYSRSLTQFNKGALPHVLDAIGLALCAQKLSAKEYAK